MIWNKEEVNEMQTQKIRKNHMDILWHEYTDKGGEEIPVTQASLTEKASIVGRVGIMLLSCGTGAWRVRSSMNALAEEMGITCTADIGLMSIEYTCFDGDDGFTQSLCLTNTGVNTSKLNRLEHFIREFEQGGQDMSGEQLHKLLDQIEEIHGLYSPIALGMAAALACSGFTFLLGGGLIEMFCAFVGAGIGNFIRCKLSKHHFTLFLCIASSVSAACLVYAGLLKAAEILWEIPIQHEAGYICAMFISTRKCCFYAVFRYLSSDLLHFYSNFKPIFSVQLLLLFSFLLKRACINRLSLPMWNDLRVSALPVGLLHFHNTL